jgi:hypothetical protein
MFSKKYNPDVINDYNNNEYIRKTEQFELKNKPYKIIITDQVDKSVKTTDDLKINVIKDNSEIKSKYDDILKERKIKNIVKKVDKKKEEEISNELSLNSLNEFICEDFDDVKSEFKSSFKEQEKVIKEDRQKFNSILESLLSDGVLD